MTVPKIIHYCWFGPRQMPTDYIHSWRKFCPEYEFRLWNEHTFPVAEHVFTESAYSLNAYAFVSDYVRAWALYNVGGVYLDTDVELKSSLDPILSARAFSGFERPGSPFTAVWGAEAGHSWPLRVLNSYNRRYDPTEPPNTQFVSEVVVSEYGIDPTHDSLQAGREGVVIHPSTTLCLDIPSNIATHHFEGSWVMHAAARRPFKEALNDRYYTSLLFPLDQDANTDAATIIDAIIAIGLGRILRAALRVPKKILAHRFRRSKTSRS